MTAAVATWPHATAEHGLAPGIASLDPPTIQCASCKATYSRPGSLHLAVILSGMLFNPKRPDDRRRLCSTCRYSMWPETVDRNSPNYGPDLRPGAVRSGDGLYPVGTLAPADALTDMPVGTVLKAVWHGSPRPDLHLVRTGGPLSAAVDGWTLASESEWADAQTWAPAVAFTVVSYPEKG